MREVVLCVVAPILVSLIFIGAGATAPISFLIASGLCFVCNLVYQIIATFLVGCAPTRSVARRRSV